MGGTAMSRTLRPFTATLLVVACAVVLFALPTGAQSRRPNAKPRPDATPQAQRPAPNAQPPAPKPISFNNDIVPIFTRAGCNQGSCHGAQYGKGGYKLS